jgi:hypothetical protein
MEVINNQNKIAKHAGFLYLTMLLGAIGLVYAPSQILDENSVVNTVQNAINKNALLRIGIMANVVCQLAFLFLAIKLFQLFRGVDVFLSLSLLCIVIASIPVTFLLIHYQVDVLFVVQQKYLSPADIQSRAQWGMIQFRNGLVFIGIFWGLWLIPFGLLVIKSGYLHRLIGYMLVAGGVMYMLDATAFILLPQLSPTTTMLLSIVSTVAELSAIFGLLSKGYKTHKII